MNVIEVRKPLKMVGHQFIPTTEYEHRQIEQAEDERIIKTGKFNFRKTSTTGLFTPTIKKGGTRPPAGINSMSRLLIMSEPNNKRGGIGNAAMGGVFKSIYLA